MGSLEEIFKKNKKGLDRKGRCSTFCVLSPLKATVEKAGKLFFINELKIDFEKNHFYFKKDLIVEMRPALSTALPTKAKRRTAEMFFESKVAFLKN